MTRAPLDRGVPRLHAPALARDMERIAREAAPALDGPDDAARPREAMPRFAGLRDGALLPRRPVPWPRAWVPLGLAGVMVAAVVVLGWALWSAGRVGGLW